MKTTAFLLTMLVPAVVSAQQKPTTGYAPVNGLKMYYEVHGSGEPVVLLRGAFMTITNNWTDWIGELSKTRKVIAVEMQGNGRTADIDRDITSEKIARVFGRDDWTPLELFLGGVRGWDTSFRRRIEYGRPFCQ